MKYEGKRVIGITGGIGSGKSKVLEIIKNKYNAVVVEADIIGHELQAPCEEAYNLIINEFGEGILEEPCVAGVSNIDRKKLGAIAFSDKEKLTFLNGVIHPAVHNKIEKIINDTASTFIFIEAAILTETSLVELTDEIWYIYADKSVRLDRLQQFRNISKEKAELVMKNQPDEECLRRKCDKVINNSGSIDETMKQIQTILDKTQEDHYE
ncbi:MAG: dephospho-CoA kinase [Lachnospiraceae bacterium]|nr:dephospho-CoA kinase [Lachnospiraceae bacterium]